MKVSNRKNLSGFHLIELLFCLLIISMLLIASTQSLDFYNRRALDLVYDEIKRIIIFARSLALKDGVALKLKPLDDSSKDWSSGIILSMASKIKDEEKILYEWQWPKSNIKLSWKGFQSSTYLIFSPILRQSTANGVFSLENASLEKRKIVLSRLGTFQNE